MAFSFILMSTWWANFYSFERYLEYLVLLWWKLVSNEMRLRWNCLKYWKNLERSTSTIKLEIKFTVSNKTIDSFLKQSDHIGKAILIPVFDIHRIEGLI